MAMILDPEPGMSVYDPTCGTAGLLLKCDRRLLDTHGVRRNWRKVLPQDVAPLRIVGQEINPSTVAISRMSCFIHDVDAEIALGDTMQRPALTEGGRLRRLDLVTANVMWNQNFPLSVYENDPYGRCSLGVPPSSSADWGWLQHMVASLDEDGRMAVVLDTGAVSRGSGNQGSNRERDIRRLFVEGDLTTPGDLVESVILLPENLFYNTSAPAIVIVVNRRKRHSREVVLVNASQMFTKGWPKNFLDEEHITHVARLYDDWAA